MPQDYNSNKFLYQINSYAPTRDEINSTERMLMRFSVSMEIIPFATLDNQESRKNLVYRNICFVSIVYVFPPPSSSISVISEL